MSKKSFKVVLNSNDFNSYSGSLTNASFYIDLKQILHDPNDFNKAWNMSFSLKSVSASTSNSGLTSTRLYGIRLDLNKETNIYQNISKWSPKLSGLLSFNNDFTAYTSTACNYFWDSKESDNKPIFIDNLQNINYVNLTIYDLYTVLATPTYYSIVDSSGTKETYLRYVCILTFEEAL